MLDLLPSVYKPNGFKHPLDAEKLWNDLSERPNDRPNDESNEDPNRTFNEGSNDRLGNGRNLLKEKLLEISNWATSKRLEALTLAQSNHFNKAVHTILALLQNIVEFAPRSTQILIP